MNARVRFRSPRIVQPGRHWTRWARAALLVLLFAGAAVLGWRYGCRGEIASLQLARVDIERIQKMFALAEKERQTLQQELESLRQGRSVDRASLGELKEEIWRLQEERIQLNQELELMRGVLSEDKTQSALLVQDFGIRKLDAEDRYLVAFTIRQLNKEFGVARGSIRFAVSGEAGGHAQELTLDALVADPVESLKMRFRYFQKVEQEIRLPSGFVPQSVTVEVSPDNQELPAISQTFSWSQRS